jgi:hypothetical protein
MTIHAPAHPSGTVSPQTHHHYLAWLTVSAAIVLAIGAALLLPTDVFRFAPAANAEQASLVDFRAAERASFIEGRAYPEWRALIEFRAAERDGR